MRKGEQPVAERIKFLLETRAQGNKSELGRAAGISGQAVADLIGGKKGGPSFPVLQKMLRSYPDINAEWLLFGEGEMQKSAEAPKKMSLHSNPTTGTETRSTPVAEGNDTAPQFYSVRAAANYKSDRLGLEPRPNRKMQFMAREEHDGQEILRWVSLEEIVEIISI
ncbi:hypothetical protein [Hymenobacter convexus]|uniref:hypothetical protein n=1 Tax=Hymenobacter sp. CA1UV-4 TaxID=3063782 RepID=UPI00272B10E9|nr:hypothetical protein [Hymenobacter sp. CA1UV-4]